MGDMLTPCPYCGSQPREYEHYYKPDMWSLECSSSDCPWPDHLPWATPWLPKPEATSAWNKLAQTKPEADSHG